MPIQPSNKPIVPLATYSASGSSDVIELNLSPARPVLWLQLARLVTAKTGILPTLDIITETSLVEPIIPPGLFLLRQPLTIKEEL